MIKKYIIEGSTDKENELLKYLKDTANDFEEELRNNNVCYHKKYVNSKGCKVNFNTFIILKDTLDKFQMSIAIRTNEEYIMNVDLSVDNLNSNIAMDIIYHAEKKFEEEIKRIDK